MEVHRSADTVKGRAGGKRLEVRKRREDERVGGPRPGEVWVRGKCQTGPGGRRA